MSLSKYTDRTTKIFVFSTRQIIFIESADEIKKLFLDINFFSTFWKITVGGFVNQLIKKTLALFILINGFFHQVCHKLGMVHCTY